MNKYRQLVLDIIRAGSRAVSIPIFVKIRLLDTIEETIRLCHQLRDAGARLIAIHARCKCHFVCYGVCYKQHVPMFRFFTHYFIIYTS